MVDFSQLACGLMRAAEGWDVGWGRERDGGFFGDDDERQKG